MSGEYISTRVVQLEVTGVIERREICRVTGCRGGDKSDVTLSGGE